MLGQGVRIKVTPGGQPLLGSPARVASLPNRQVSEAQRPPSTIFPRYGNAKSL